MSTSIVYSGGTIVNTTFTCTTGTRAEIVAGLSAALVAAGWTDLGSGIHRCAATPAPKSNSIRVRIFDPGSGNCAQVRIQNDAGDRISANHFLLPGVGKVYRVIANRYNFFCFTPGSSACREFVCGGTLHIPDFLNGIVNGSFGWLQSNANSDGDNSAQRACFRYVLHGNSFVNTGYNSQIRNGSLLDINNGNQPAQQQLVVPAGAFLTATGNQAFRWSDDSICSTEAIMCFGISSQTDEGKRQGLIHNCFVSSDSFPADTIATSIYDGHHWFAITNGNVGSSTQARGTLFVAID